jgi:hypothetical protein
VSSIESEELIPFTAGTIAVTPGVSDINGIVAVAFASDSSGSVVEVEGLSWSSVSGLNDESVRDMIKESSTGHCCLDVEWSVDVHTPDLAVTRSWEFACSVDVKDCPFLVILVVLVLSYYLSVLMIKFALNCKNLSLLVDEVFALILPKLVPS